MKAMTFDAWCSLIGKAAFNNKIHLSVTETRILAMAVSEEHDKAIAIPNADHKTNDLWQPVYPEQ